MVSSVPFLRRYWAVALPAWVCVTVVTAYFAYERCALREIPRALLRCQLRGII